MGFISSAVGGLVSGLAGNIFNKHEADKNRDWQENMSNTSVTRRVEDLENAGFNKLLAVQSAQGGASTPSTQPFQADTSSVLGALQLAEQKRTNDANIQKTKAEEENIRQKTINDKQDEVSKRLDNILKRNDINMLDFRNKILAAQTQQEFNKVISSELNNVKLNQEIKGLIVRTAKEDWELERSKADPANTVTGMYEKHKAEVHKNPWTSGSVWLDKFGNAVSNWINRVDTQGVNGR